VGEGKLVKVSYISGGRKEFLLCLCVICHKHGGENLQLINGFGYLHPVAVELPILYQLTKLFHGFHQELFTQLHYTSNTSSVEWNMIFFSGPRVRI